MRSSSSESDRTYDSSCREKSSDRRRLSSSAARRRSCSERSNRCRKRHNTSPAPAKIRAIAIVANSSACCRSTSMGIYIQLYILRINLLLCLSLAACDAEARPGVSRVWPEFGTMMSAAAWGTDSTRVARTLDAARDSVDHIDSLLQRHVSIAALDAVRREIRRRTGIALVADSIAPGYALDRAALALANVVDSALLDLGGQYLWVGPPAPPARPTRRACGGLQVSRIVFRSHLRAGPDPRAFLIEQSQRVAPGIAGQTLVADGQLFGEADAGIEEVDRRRLLPCIELK